MLRRRGIVALISDFQAEGWEKAIGALRRRHDVVALHLADPREGDVPAAGLVAFIDPETGARVVADTSRPEVRRALRAPGFGAAQAVFKKTRVDALALSTGESYDRPLSGFFKARERRR